ncbi:MAG: hypothetical protein Q4G67_15590, partial [Actinomycetia bacterium]|nr:hypothetical protein [Actinomycetes bacterium]
MSETEPPTTLAREESAVGEVVLRRRGEHIELIVNGVFVMDTVDVSTEVELAELALARHPQPAQVLVGGLGLGFTAERVLQDRRVEQVLVAEVAEPLTTWARDGLLPGNLADERLELHVGDVAEVLRATQGEWDLILLDVDNGPGFLVREENADLYALDGLRATVDALAPAGVLAIWSSQPAPELLSALESLADGRALEVLR